MEEVTCTLEIELTEHDCIFGDSWNFTISIYEFTKISDTRVQVKYQYQDEVTKIEEDGTHVIGLTSWSEAYVVAEENLQTLLDIITLDRSGIGLRIAPDSLLQSSRHIRDGKIEQTHSVNIPSIENIRECFERLLKDGDEKLYDALRMNRLAANEDNTGEKIGQLWGAVEALYASKAPKVLDTKAKRKEIIDLIERAKLITPEEKERLKQRVIDTDAKSIPRMVAAKLSLIDGDGNEQPIEDVEAKASEWRAVRSPQAHGNVLIRSREAHFLASEMEHLLEQIIGAEVNPSRYVFAVFLPTDVQQAFSTDKKAKKDPTSSGFLSRGIYVFASMDMVKLLRHNLRDNASVIYLVDYKTITAVTRISADVIDIDKCPKEARSFIQSRMDFLNHR